MYEAAEDELSDSASEDLESEEEEIEESYSRPTAKQRMVFDILMNCALSGRGAPLAKITYSPYDVNDFHIHSILFAMQSLRLMNQVVLQTPNLDARVKSSESGPAKRRRSSIEADDVIANILRYMENLMRSKDQKPNSITSFVSAVRKILENKHRLKLLSIVPLDKDFGVNLHNEFKQGLPNISRLRQEIRDAGVRREGDSGNGIAALTWLYKHSTPEELTKVVEASI